MDQRVDTADRGKPPTSSMEAVTATPDLLVPVPSAPPRVADVRKRTSQAAPLRMSVAAVCWRRSATRSSQADGQRRSELPPNQPHEHDRAVAARAPPATSDFDAGQDEPLVSEALGLELLCGRSRDPLVL